MFVPPPSRLRDLAWISAVVPPLGGGRFLSPSRSAELSEPRLTHRQFSPANILIRRIDSEIAFFTPM
jgi:hypothetical protein